MLASLVLVALATSPRILPDADFALYVPSVTAAKGELAFFSKVGQHSALLDPRGWSGDLHPLVALDLTRPETFTAAGLDPNGPSTWSTRGDLKLTCTPLTDAQRFTHAADARLQTLGEPWSAKADGTELHGAKVAGEVQAGYVVASHTACAVSGPGAERTLRYVGRWLSTSWPAQSTLPRVKGHVFAITPAAVSGLTSNGRVLVVDGRGDRRISLEPARAQTYALPSTGLFRARATFTPSALAHSARTALGLRCEGCSKAQLDTLERALAESLTGESLVRVDRFQPNGPLSSPEGQFSGMRLGAVARLRNPEPVRQALTAIAGAPAHEPDVWHLSVRGGTLELGIRGDALYVANDETARDQALAAAKLQHKPSHALELAMDPALTANGLGRISLLDAISNKQLAGAFAFATEAVPVLRATRAVTGWADPSGAALRFGGTWVLLDQPAR